ncbi:MAG: hypothetical protein Q9170_006181 [Blastenia crenularia]
MPLLFQSVCALLQALEDNGANTKKALKGWLDQRNKDTIESWVKSHKITVDSSEVDVVAVLSALFPKDRTDRVYGYQEASLISLLGRCLGIGKDRVRQLREWDSPGHGELGACLERVVRQTEHQEPINPVTLDEVDATLLWLAARNRFSAPGVRAVAQEDGLETLKVMRRILLRFSSIEAKWFTRMILKNYSTLDFKTYYVLNAIDFRLAGALNVHSTFEAAVGALCHQSTTSGALGTSATTFKPVVGSKVGRVPYLKGRSVKNVVKLAEGRQMSVERKYDGEYCQVHVNLDKGDNWIQIFSKSGKDSTVDRSGLHEAIKQSLRIGQQGCKFTRQCILEGEMVVYNDLENKVSDFHKIRKHVSRSGSWLGRDLDSQRRRLEGLITRIGGRANLTKQKIVDFSSPQGPEKLRTLMAHAITHRWEGLVLKPSAEPYFGTRRASGGLPAHHWIKMKKDYIPGLGDTADFAVVGAGYNASRAAQLHCPNMKWTQFHIGCLKNKEEVKGKNAKPHFMVVTALGVNQEMAKHLNQHGQFRASPFGSLASYQDPFEITLARGISKMDVVFRKPFVFDVMGAGFEKESNRDFFTIRFPRVLKIHSDRDWKESVGFDELQRMAKVARTVPEDTKSCVAGWMEQLEQVDRGAKGSTVPRDLSDDDIETPQEVCTVKAAQPFSRRSSKRPSEVSPMIRMDTQEMTDRELRLDSGEVVQRPLSQHSLISNWSESVLPTPPRSSPSEGIQIAPDRQPLSSMQSSNSTDRQRKRSQDDELVHPDERRSKRHRVSPPARRTKSAADIRIMTSNSKLPPSYKGLIPGPSHNSSSNLPKQPAQALPPSESFLVPKLSVGAAEALRDRAGSRTTRAMEPISPDCQTTSDERSTQPSQPTQSTQQSLISSWNLQPTSPLPEKPYPLPDLHDSYIVLSPDISTYTYLTHDLLSTQGLASRPAHRVFAPQPNSLAARPPVSYLDETKTQDMIILIEGRRHDSSLEMLKFLIGRVPEDGSQVFWVFDWRWLEDVFARGVLDEGRLKRKRLIARFWCEEGEMRWLRDDGEVWVISKENVEESKGMGGAFLAE